MRPALLMLVLAAANAFPSPTYARLQPDIVCLDTDIEFLVACDDDED